MMLAGGVEPTGWLVADVIKLVADVIKLVADVIKLVAGVIKPRC
jgi:hypothetical protein